MLLPWQLQEFGCSFSAFTMRAPVPVIKPLNAGFRPSRGVNAPCEATAARLPAPQVVRIVRSSSLFNHGQWPQSLRMAVGQNRSVAFWHGKTLLQFGLFETFSRVHSLGCRVRTRSWMTWKKTQGDEAHWLLNERPSEPTTLLNHQKCPNEPTTAVEIYGKYTFLFQNPPSFLVHTS